jgi:hypothetical protein
MAFLTTPLVGPNLTQVDTTAVIKVGTVGYGNDGSKWMYVKAMSTIAQYDCVVITNSGSAVGGEIGAVPVTTTNALTSPRVAFAQTAITSASYGWVALEGNNLRVNCLIACQPKVPLFTTATAGSLDDTVVTAGHVHGVVALSSATSASAPPIIAAHPHIGIYGGG